MSTPVPRVPAPLSSSPRPPGSSGIARPAPISPEPGTAVLSGLGPVSQGHESKQGPLPLAPCLAPVPAGWVRAGYRRVQGEAMAGTARRSSLDAPLQFGNYMEKFQLLLHLEEVQMEVDIRRYDLQNTPMVHDSDNKRLLVLKVRAGAREEGHGLPGAAGGASLSPTELFSQVPGVAENRPSVLRGDHLFATLSSERGRRGLVQYKGYVHRVELERVKLGFSKG